MASGIMNQGSNSNSNGNNESGSGGNSNVAADRGNTNAVTTTSAEQGAQSTSSTPGQNAFSTTSSLSSTATASSATPTPTSTSSASTLNSNLIHTIIGGVIAVVAVLLLFAFLAWLLPRRRRKQLEEKQRAADPRSSMAIVSLASHAAEPARDPRDRAVSPIGDDDYDIPPTYEETIRSASNLNRTPSASPVRVADCPVAARSNHNLPPQHEAGQFLYVDEYTQYGGPLTPMSARTYDTMGFPNRDSGATGSSVGHMSFNPYECTPTVLAPTPIHPSTSVDRLAEDHAAHYAPSNYYELPVTRETMGPPDGYFELPASLPAERSTSSGMRGSDPRTRASGTLGMCESESFQPAASGLGRDTSQRTMNTAGSMGQNISELDARETEPRGRTLV